MVSEFCLFSRILISFFIKSLFGSLFSSYFFRLLNSHSVDPFLDNNTLSFYHPHCLNIYCYNHHHLHHSKIKNVLFCLDSNFRRKTKKHRCWVRKKWGFPNCAGILDGWLINIKCPKNRGSCYFNYKGVFRVVFLSWCWL